MSSYESIVTAAAELVGQLTNIVGMVEKNQQSLDAIRARGREKRAHAVLEELLERLVGIRASNRETLWRIGRLAQEGRLAEDTVAVRPLTPAGLPLGFDDDLQAFLSVLVDLRAYLAEHHGTLVRENFALLEQAQDAVDARIAILELLLDDRRRLSRDRAAELYRLYEALIDGLAAYKAALDRQVREG